MKLRLSDLKSFLVAGLAGSIFIVPGEVELTTQVFSDITVGSLGIKSRVKYRHSETVPQQLKVRCLALGHYFTVVGLWGSFTHLIWDSYYPAHSVQFFQNSPYEMLAVQSILPWLLQLYIWHMMCGMQKQSQEQVFCCCWCFFSIF